jgi:hypothetical protein
MPKPFVALPQNCSSAEESAPLNSDDTPEEEAAGGKRRGKRRAVEPSSVVVEGEAESKSAERTSDSIIATNSAWFRFSTAAMSILTWNCFECKM